MIYSLYGIIWDIPFCCPELNQHESGESDVCVRLEAFPTIPFIDWVDEGVCWKAAPGVVLLSVPSVAVFLIKQGREIFIKLSPSIQVEELKPLLFNAVASFLLAQRGMLPLGGSAVEINGKVILILGGASTGKSFLAAALMSRGGKPITDTLCVIKSEDVPFLMPGYPYLRLWEKGLSALEISAAALSKDREGLEKYQLPFNAAQTANKIHAAIFLQRSLLPKTTLMQVSGGEKYSEFTNSLRYGIREKTVCPELETFIAISSLAKKIPAFYLRASHHRAALPSTLDILCKNFAA